MSSAPPDLASALGLVADEARPLAGSTAELAIGRARARRRRTWGTGLVLVACVALCTPLVLSVVGDLDGTGDDAAGARSSGTGYDPTVDRPAPWVRPLPLTLDEPLALTYQMSSELGGAAFSAVSASGRQWTLPGSGFGMTPSLAPGGWQIAWQESADLVVRDLRDGSETRMPYGGSYVDAERTLSEQTQQPWSTDGRYLALNLNRTSLEDEPGIVIVEPAAGTSSVVMFEGAVLGWVDRDTMLAYAWDRSEVVTLELDGRREVVGTGWRGLPGWNLAALSPDGAALVGPGDTSAGAIVYDVTDGAERPVGCAGCTSLEPYSWTSPGDLLVRGTDPERETEQMLALDVSTGSVGTLLTFSPRFDGGVDRISIARAVLAEGARGTPHTSAAWPGWYLDLATYGVCGLLLLLVGIAVVRRVTRSLRGARRTAAGPHVLGSRR